MFEGSEGSFCWLDYYCGGGATVKMQILLFQAGANAKRCCHQLRWFCKSRVKDIELCYDKKMTTVRGGLSIQGQFGNSFLH